MTARAAPAPGPERSPERTIVIECDLPHAPAKVWRTLTEPELLAKWLMPNDIRPEIGHRFSFQAGAVTEWDGVVDCEVLAVEPQRRLSYAWRGGAPRRDGYGERIDTVVTWTLTPIDTGTRLLLVHDGFPPASFAVDGMRGVWNRLVTGCLPGLLAREPSI